MLELLASVAIGLVIYQSLSRDPLAQYDKPEGEYFPSDNDSSSLQSIKSDIKSDLGKARQLPLKAQLSYLRQSLDSFFDKVEKVADFQPIDDPNIRGEWVLAPGVHYSRRLLYIHGGAFYIGSPKSHRVITSRLSEIANCAVLAVDYRLMPEHKRAQGIEDCRNAYDWMLAHSPLGEDKQTTAVFVAGDSAGGNLTLSLLSWIRDSQRPVPNAAIALSPVTDMRMRNPSIKSNSEQDVILSPLYKLFNRLPRLLIMILNYFNTGYRATHPDISPLHGDLANLCPILVHASDHEMLRDDARRYVNKALEAGTEAKLQLWSHMPHVWHIFYPKLAEADRAFEQIRLFINRHG